MNNTIKADAQFQNYIQEIYDYDRKIKTAFDLSSDEKCLFKNVDCYSFMNKDDYLQLIKMVNNEHTISNQHPYSLMEIYSYLEFTRMISNSNLFNMTAQYIKNNIILPIYSHIDWIQGFIYEIWFNKNKSRSVEDNINGFEHVFMGGITKNNDLTGLHNWVRIFLVEQTTKMRFKVVEENNILAAVVNTKDIYGNSSDGKLSTFFKGVSPTFEIIFHTMCILYYILKSEPDIQQAHNKLLESSCTPNTEAFIDIEISGQKMQTVGILVNNIIKTAYVKIK